jgi:outer membrane protein OmpA-like peptidoglycan-associated protein
MSDSSLSFISTSSFRNSLLARNLAPYTIQGVYTPPVSNTTYETVIGDLNVVDSPNNLISDSPFPDRLYPLNEYGPEGGYVNTVINNKYPIKPNKGEYDPNDTELDLVNEFYIDAAYIENRYGPIGGFMSMVVIDSIQNNNKLYTPYWEPPTFVPSSYTPYQILLSNDPSGTSGLLSQDSYIAKLGAQTLKNLLQDRLDVENEQTNGSAGNLDMFSNSFDASLLVSGRMDTTPKNYKITIPEQGLGTSQSFTTRIADNFFPASPIPGNYFIQTQINGGASAQIASGVNALNQITGGAIGGILNTLRNPSQLFLANTGNGQRSILFSNLDYNRYQPGYDKNLGAAVAVGQFALNALGVTSGGYYVGSKNADPSTITSPPNQIPVDAFGRQVQTPVYGPSELGILYEGNENKLNFGLAGKSYTDGGGIDGQFIWTSPKYKGNAGYKATPGGGVGSLDTEFNQITSQYTSNESTNVTFKPSSILDATQRLVESADNVAGITKLKHVGNAINQVSKVFNDGYKELTKGSRVLSYVDNATGGESGIEYCRVFTKDTPYYTYADLQKTDGITTSGRRFVNSVFDNTYNLNIVPLRNPGSTNIQPNEKGQLIAKKYMFSIENLAWRTSSRPGLTYDDLPVCERGPNGGRVMWFPPYDLTFSDSSTANFQSTNFLGRPEPMYTYNNTTRTGSISWKIIVDHPSVMNTIIEKQLKGQQKEKIDSIIDSFFAGCVKYDIYELAKKFNMLKPSDIFEYQEILNNPRLTKEELEGVNKEIQKQVEVPVSTAGNTNGLGGGSNLTQQKQVKYQDDPDIKDFQDRYKEIAFYFHNDIPYPQQGVVANESFDQTFTKYETLIPSYVNTADSLFGTSSNFCKKTGTVTVTENAKTNVDTGKSYQTYCNEAKNVKQFFDTVIQSNYNLIYKDTKNFIVDAFNIIKKGGSISIEMVGSASALSTQDYNKNLSLRRIDSVKKFFEKTTVGDANLKQAIQDKKFIIKETRGEGEDISIPKAGVGDTFGFEVNCRQDVRGGNNDITDNSKAQIYSVYAMACRRVKITNIIVDLKQIEVKDDDSKNQGDPETPKTEIKTVTPQTKIIPPRLQPNVSVTKKLKDGISKKLLRNLFSECDYFDVIERENPTVLQTIKEKIKYFNPAFHSMTPEGLNSRLTFLNQCVRPGETIPVIGADGRPKFNDALNTSFGAPPILVLRIGDFYNTKIVPTTIGFTYESNLLDMNPEGIGIQPMIVKVSLSFNMIGGHGLAKPVEELQNALSFNYYANTEIYDERATPTDDSYKKIDKELEQLILAGEKSANVNNVTNSPTNDGGDTIGDIQTNIPIPSGQTGVTSYLKVMDKLFDETVSYMNTVVNQMEKLNLTYNAGILQLVNDVREYKTGTIYLNGSPQSLTYDLIWGQPAKDDQRLSYLFTEVLKQIESNDNPILVGMIKTSNQSGWESTSPEITELKLNLTNYVKELSSTFSNGITTTYSDITNLEDGYVQLLRKVNLLETKTDGKILESNVPRAYNITPTKPVSESSLILADKPQDTFEELNSDYKKVIDTLKTYSELLNTSGITTSDEYNSGDFRLADNNSNWAIEEKLFFMVISRILDNKNKKQEFITSLTKGNLSKNNKFKNKLEKVVDKIGDKYSKELRQEEKLFEKFRKSKDFKAYVDAPLEKLYAKGKTRKFEYTTVPSANVTTQNAQILALYTKKINRLEF